VKKHTARADAPSRFDVFLTDLHPTRGSEISKRRPCVVVTPDDINRAMSIVVIAPMTTSVRDRPWRVACRFGGKNGQILLNQLRTVDRLRFARRLGRLDRKTAATVLDVLAEMFAP
jgi:mRNA interferase MazF